MKSFQTSYLEISKSAYRNNLKFIHSYLKKGVQFCSVVKGNAYGHGIEVFVPLARESGVDWFAVFSADEALRVYRVVKQPCRIMIMGYMNSDQVEWAIEHGIEFYVFDMQRLLKTLEFASRIGKQALIHVELETGMNRTGFEPGDLKRVIQLLKQNSEHLHLRGICTHLAGSENIANYYRIQQQQKVYARLLKRFEHADCLPEYKHMACSAASLRYPKTQMDLVRLGILQYGFFPTREVWVEYMSKKRHRPNPLQRLISWKSVVMDVKWVKSGEFVGYGTSYLASSNIRIATIPVGYSNGFSRSLSNQGRVLIRGRRVSVIGTINMSMVIVDVTEIPDVNTGDEVVLIGKQGDLEISVSSFSEFSDQVNYEMLTRLPADIPRYTIE